MAFVTKFNQAADFLESVRTSSVCIDMFPPTENDRYGAKKMMF